MPHHEHERSFRARRHDPGDTAGGVRRRATAFAVGVTVAILGTFGAVICGCFSDSHPQVVYAVYGPPAEPVEVEGGAPSPSYLWVRGNWYWNGVEYIWIPGHWQSRPHPHAVWTSGNWHRTRGGWVFTEGHWS